jgi:DNA-binding NarL/FixJ family response regulator
VIAPRVLIVDPEAHFRATLVRSLARDKRMTVVGEAANGMEAVHGVFSLKPDVVLIDPRTPNHDGIKATRRIAADHPEVKVLVLTSSDTDASVLDALSAGASGYVLKESPREAVIAAVVAVAAGERVISAPVVGLLLKMLDRQTSNTQEFHNGLSRRRVEILRMLASGMNNKQIAQQVGLRDTTVRNYVSSIYRQLHIDGRSQAILYAFRTGLVDADDIGAGQLQGLSHPEPLDHSGSGHCVESIDGYGAERCNPAPTPCE